MRSSVLYKMAMVAMLGTALYGCAKKSPLSIDNNQIVQKPYSLYVVDTIGAIWHTNDGEHFTQVKGGGAGAGVEIRSICTSDTNIIMVYNNAFVSDDNGKNFNPVSSNEVFPNPAAMGQSMLYDVPSFNRVYIASYATSGVSYSDSNGRMYTWKPDNDPNITSQITSFTQLADGTLIGFANGSKETFTLTGVTAQWQKTVTTTPLGNGNFFISHFGNTILAADRTGETGVWYSDNKGADWYQFTGLPPATKILSVNTLFDQAVLVGTDGAGAYRVVPRLSTVFEPSNDGLASNVRVTGIAAKSNVYKNNAVKQFVYLSTNKGFYKSEDLGRNWVEVQIYEQTKNLSAIY